jgi:hypothetical protein
MPGQVETRFGTLNSFDGFPDKATAGAASPGSAGFPYCRNPDASN